jgi:hypothetical protein
MWDGKTYVEPPDEAGPARRSGARLILDPYVKGIYNAFLASALVWSWSWEWRGIEDGDMVAVLD